jgi:TIGR03009 family protein
LTPEQQKEMRERERLAKELDKVLVEWERKSSEIRTLHGKHKRMVYNMVFEVEKVSEGTFFLETPDKGRIDLVGSKLGKSAVSGRKNKATGKPFTIEEDRSEKWICNGESVIAVNDEEMTYEKVTIPVEERGANIVNSPLPFLFGMKAADMKQRYKMTLMERESPKEVLIIARPLTSRDLQNYTEAWIILEKERYLPKFVKLFDPSGNLESVYQFLDVKVNERKFFVAPWADKDPYNPDLKKLGYKLVLPKINENDEILPASGTTRPPASPPGTAPRSNAPSGMQPAPRVANPKAPSQK